MFWLPFYLCTHLQMNFHFRTIPCERKNFVCIWSEILSFFVLLIWFGFVTICISTACTTRLLSFLTEYLFCFVFSYFSQADFYFILLILYEVHFTGYFAFCSHFALSACTSACLQQVLLPQCLIGIFQLHWLLYPLLRTALVRWLPQTETCHN